eukprot:TRINITY_DN78732_c0_g1_i1.p1 TRINITY_DN78732_c0_g1~~TRINITY_DN78732_c0_g1_i1.p1  ORF type:complete len:119 (+),score=14.85 TRINITY_DN78732_c0_g1_i1:155-511(+)
MGAVRPRTSELRRLLVTTASGRQPRGSKLPQVIGERKVIVQRVVASSSAHAPGCLTDAACQELGVPHKSKVLHAVSGKWREMRDWPTADDVKCLSHLREDDVVTWLKIGVFWSPTEFM